MFLQLFLGILLTLQLVTAAPSKPPTPKPRIREQNDQNFAQQFVASKPGELGQRIIDLALQNARTPQQQPSMAPAIGAAVVNCGDASRDLACKLYQQATSGSNKFIVMPPLSSILLNTTPASTSSSPLVTLAMMCSIGSANGGACISEELLRRLIAMTSAGKAPLFIVDSFQSQNGAVDFVCRQQDNHCKQVAQSCRNIGKMKTVDVSRGASQTDSPTATFLQVLAKVVSGPKKDDASLMRQLGIGEVRCQLDGPGATTPRRRDKQFWPSTTELPLPPGIQTIPPGLRTTPRNSAGTQLNIDNMDFNSIVAAIADHYAAIEADLRLVFQQMKSVPSATKSRAGVSSGAPPSNSNWEGQVRQAMHKAWKNRLLIHFRHPPPSRDSKEKGTSKGRTPQTATPQGFKFPPKPPQPGKPGKAGGKNPWDQWDSWGSWGSWDSYVKPLSSVVDILMSAVNGNDPEIPPSDDRTTTAAMPLLDELESTTTNIMTTIAEQRHRRQANYYNYYSQCSSDAVRAACQLLDLNNNGTAFLLPWVLEDLFTGARTSTTAQSSTPLAVAIAVCSGQQASTYFGSKLCPNQAMLQSAGAAATLSFKYYATPTYISSFVGNPSYARSGKPSTSHFAGTAVDFLCGPYVYNPPADDSCPRLSSNCYKAYLRSAFFPAQDPNMGCGNYTVLPITATHCSY